MNKKKRIFPKLFETKLQAQIIEHLLEHDSSFYTISQMARNLGVSSSAVSSRLEKIQKLGLIQILPAKRAKIFKLNESTELTKILKHTYNKLKKIEFPEPETS